MQTKQGKEIIPFLILLSCFYKTPNVVYIQITFLSGIYKVHPSTLLVAFIPKVSFELVVAEVESVCTSQIYPGLTVRYAHFSEFCLKFRPAFGSFPPLPSFIMDRISCFLHFFSFV